MTDDDIREAQTRARENWKLNRGVIPEAGALRAGFMVVTEEGEVRITPLGSAVLRAVLRGERPDPLAALH